MGIPLEIAASCGLDEPHQYEDADSASDLVKREERYGVSVLERIVRLVPTPRCGNRSKITCSSRASQAQVLENKQVHPGRNAERASFL